MTLKVELTEHAYNNIMTVDSISLGRMPYKGIIMSAINAIKCGEVQNPKTEWVPVSEGAPKKADYYITTTIYKEVYRDYWNGERFERTETVIAWRPLPEPYQSEVSK